MNTSFEPKTQEPKRRASQEESQSAISYPSRTIVHAKLEMTSPGDRDEQEADAVANEVVSGGKIARKISGGGGSSGIAVSRQMESRLLQQQGGGQPMPSGLRSQMESSFGRDFSPVRLHTDSEAASLSDGISAKAFTLGSDIYFNQGEFTPNSDEGQRLVAHELTHIAQGNGKIARKENNKRERNEKRIKEMASHLEENFISGLENVEFNPSNYKDPEEPGKQPQLYDIIEKDYTEYIYDENGENIMVVDEQGNLKPKSETTTLYYYKADCDVQALEGIRFLESKKLKEPKDRVKMKNAIQTNTYTDGTSFDYSMIHFSPPNKEEDHHVSLFIHEKQEKNNPNPKTWLLNHNKILDWSHEGKIDKQAFIAAVRAVKDNHKTNRRDMNERGNLSGYNAEVHYYGALIKATSSETDL